MRSYASEGQIMHDLAWSSGMTELWLINCELLASRTDGFELWNFKCEVLIPRTDSFELWKMKHDLLIPRTDK